MEAWEPWVAAAFAPAAVWVLWRFQTWSVEFLRWRLVKLVGHANWLYATVSFFGVLLHELSHASVLLLSGHGVKEFRSGMESGHVLPARTRTGFVGTLSFLVAALAPMFIPPLLVLLGVVFLVDRGVVDLLPGGDGLLGAWEGLRVVLVEFPVRFAQAVARLDLAHWPHLVVLLLLLLGMPAARPSHIKRSRFHGGSEGDVAVLRARIRHNPVPFLLFLALLYAAYLTVRVWLPEAYWGAFQWVWAVAATGVLLSAFGAAWWSLAAMNARTSLLFAWVPFLLFVAVETALRVVRPTDPMWANAAAVAAWAGATAVLRFMFPRRVRSF
ncbi:MAG: hypothetical protein QOD77_1738 [Thermoplasmata archaeon]|jgi:hypothetical protein|nr:hypothetical protein [Thermoplasmata archaeon]